MLGHMAKPPSLFHLGSEWSFLREMAKILRHMWLHYLNAVSSAPNCSARSDVVML